MSAASSGSSSGGRGAGRLRRVGAHGALLLGSTVVGLLLMEGTLRWIVPSSVQSDRHYVWPPGMRAEFAPDPAIMPGIEGRSLFVVNSRGIRGDELPAGPSYRILAVGGSTTECLFLDQSEAWPQLLQEGLGVTELGHPVWVGNIGKSGLSTRDNIVQLRYLLPELPRIDAAVFLLGVNDLGLRNLQGSRYDPWFMSRKGAEGDLLPRAFGVYPLDDPTLPWHRRTALWQLGRSVVRQILATGRAYQDHAGRNYLRWRAQRRAATRIVNTMPDLTSALAEYARNVKTLAGLAREHGVRPIFLTQPTIWRSGLPEDLQARLWVGELGDGGTGEEYASVGVLASEMALYNRTLAETCRSLDVECFDLASRVPRDGTVFYDDDHFNERGARLVADLVASFLRARAPFRPGDVGTSSGSRPSPTPTGRERR